MMWFRKPRPAPLTEAQKIASAASFLSRHTAAKRRAISRSPINAKLDQLRADIAAGRISRIADRDTVVAEVRR